CDPFSTLFPYTTLFRSYFVVIDMVGLLEAVLWFVVLVGIGVVWFTPEIEYAATTTDVEPVIVTTMFPVPLGFVRYQNSASLLERSEERRVGKECREWMT